MKYSPRMILRTLYRRLFVYPQGGGRPLPKEVLDKEYASGNWGHFFSWDELPRHAVLAGAVHHFYARPAILDVGCGSGRLAQLLNAHPFESYLGLDISTEGLNRARALGLVGMDFCEGDFEAWRSDKMFDAIIFNECLGYAVDPGRTVEMFASFLRPEGRIFISIYRFGGEKPIWRRICEFAVVEAAASVMSDKDKIWDIKVLRSRSKIPR